ncbi:MAG TPA: RidA family protein [Thermoanaerobaculia bacterium]|nr:RidA family protein [Thermoanaerobaculia bacterium]
MPTPIRSLTLAAVALALAGCASAPPAAPAHYPSSPATLPFSEAVRDGDLLFVSGQIGNPPGKLELVPGGLRAEAAQALENIRAIVERHGSSMTQVVKCTVFLADMKEWGDFNEVYRKAFPGKLPARSALGANGLALGARVEVECIAHVPQEKR